MRIDRRSRSWPSPRSTGSIACSRTFSTWPGSTPRRSRWSADWVTPADVVDAARGAVGPLARTSTAPHRGRCWIRRGSGSAAHVQRAGSPDRERRSVLRAAVADRDLRRRRRRWPSPDGARPRARPRSGRGVASVRAILPRPRLTATIRSARAWDSPSRAACWRPRRVASGEKTPPAAARGSRSSCRPSVRRRRRCRCCVMKVLVVDDEPAILATMAPLLRSRGYEVLTSTTGRAALETVSSSSRISRRARSRPAGCGRRRRLPAHSRRAADPDHRALGPHGRGRQGGGTRRRRRRLRHEAVRRRGTAGPDPRRAAQDGPTEAITARTPGGERSR